MPAVDVGRRVPRIEGDEGADIVSGRSLDGAAGEGSTVGVESRGLGSRWRWYGDVVGYH